ncbi:MAG: hypothetical protein DRI69_04250 [Bacteroidetes bacterium]|nr:MAG: hypothetical protein DRI69_04250 [Bacteroidota bacterium]
MNAADTVSAALPAYMFDPSVLKSGKEGLELRFTAYQKQLHRDNHSIDLMIEAAFENNDFRQTLVDRKIINAITNLSERGKILLDFLPKVFPGKLKTERKHIESLVSSLDELIHDISTFYINRDLELDDKVRDILSSAGVK